MYRIRLSFTLILTFQLLACSDKPAPAVPKVEVPSGLQDTASSPVQYAPQPVIINQPAPQTSDVGSILGAGALGYFLGNSGSSNNNYNSHNSRTIVEKHYLSVPVTNKAYTPTAPNLSKPLTKQSVKTTPFSLKKRK